METNPPPRLPVLAPALSEPECYVAYARPLTAVKAAGRYKPSPNLSSARSMFRFLTKKVSWLLVASTLTPPLRQMWAPCPKLPTSAVPGPTIVDSTTLVFHSVWPNMPVAPLFPQASVNGPPPRKLPAVPPVPSRSSRVLNQLVGCRMIASGCRNDDPAVFASTRANPLALSSAASFV
jgi:hypothetical protein